MRIAILTSVHAPLDVRILQKEGTSLATAGHIVTLLARDQPNAAQDIEARGLTFVPLQAGPSRLARIALWKQIVGHLRRLDVDAWHFHDPELLPVAVFARWLLRRNVALVYDAHEDLPKDILDKYWIPKRTRRVVSRIAGAVERWGTGRCDLVITATDSIGQRLAMSSKFCRVVHNYPLSLSPEPPDHTARPVRAIFAGGTSRKRGIMELIDAMRLVTSDLELHLVGGFLNDAFESELRAACPANVIIHGEVPFSEVAGHLSKAHIGVLTFLPVPNHVEALPNKLFEYMRAGLAVLASDFPLWRPLVVDIGCGVTVDPEQPAAIARALESLAADPDARREMGERGVAAVRDRFSWSVAESVLLAAYEELDSKRGSTKG